MLWKKFLTLIVVLAVVMVLVDSLWYGVALGYGVSGFSAAVGR